MLMIAVPVTVILVLVLPLRMHDGTSGATSPPNVITSVLLALCVITVSAHLGGIVAHRIGQPRVIGELISGILLGPSFLGLLAPSVPAFLFPSAVMPVLAGFAEVGVVFFMCLVGYELPLSLLRRSGSTAATVGHAALAVPFLGGVLLGLGPLTAYRPPETGELPFVLFVGLALSVTAFPVLAKILRERQMTRTPVGTLAIGSAAFCDVTTWSLLLVVSAMAQRDSLATSLFAVAVTAALATVLMAVARPLLRRGLARLESRFDQPRPSAEALLFFLVLACALATQALGVNAIIGGFLAGLALPRTSTTVQQFTQHTEGLTAWLLPIFFAIVGLQLSLAQVWHFRQLVLIALIVATAVVCKIGATALTARLAGQSGRDSATLGIAMNCRGLTELVALNAGLSMGIIDRRLYAMLVVMALLTTIATAPLLKLVTHRAMSGGRPGPAVDLH